ncbi:conserved hypothetical protein [Rhodobacteraceae bacterium HTCC2083]|jgi:hypothetical protein|nr:conserved hypothetical protein [Rhodobacteraceae bacterium HTCC2083]
MSLLSKLLYPFVRNVQKSATDFGGHCTWQFSQMRDPVASIIATNPGSAEGICEMLSAKWLEGHANDAHIANWIMSGDAIDASKVRYLMQLLLIGTTVNRSAIIGHAVRGGTIDQDEASKRWLAAKGRHVRKIRDVRLFQAGLTSFSDLLKQCVPRSQPFSQPISQDNERRRLIWFRAALKREYYSIPIAY